METFCTTVGLILFAIFTIAVLLSGGGYGGDEPACGQGPGA